MNTRTRTKEKYMSSRGDAHAGLCNHDDCLDQCCQTAQYRSHHTKFEPKVTLDLGDIR